MAVPARKEKQEAGSVECEALPPPLVKTQKKPSIKIRVFERVVVTLYRAIIHRTGLFANVTMETHAPQLIYYPGSPYLKKRSRKVTVKAFAPQFGLFDEQQHETPSEEIQEVLAKLVHRYPAMLPPGTLEHRRWLWFTALTDRREKSKMVYPAHCYIYEDHPEFYNDGVYYISADQFRKELKRGKYKVGSPDQSAGNWLICAYTLFTRFNGDPVELLKHAGWSVDKVYAWKKSERKRLGYDPIPGWGRKLISLYFKYLNGLGYPLPDDAFASDVHAQAIPLQVGAVDYGTKDVIYSGPYAEMIRKAATEVCNRRRFDIILYAHSDWLLGSELCTNCAGNPEVPKLCPIYDMCQGRIDTSWYFSKGRWPKGLQIMVKGGQAPKFGVPTDVVPRERTAKKGKTKRELADIKPLFPQRNKKVIPITLLSAK